MENFSNMQMSAIICMGFLTHFVTSLAINAIVMRTMLHPEKWWMSYCVLALAHNFFTVMVVYMDSGMEKQSPYLLAEGLFLCGLLALMCVSFEDAYIKTILASIVGEIIASVIVMLAALLMNGVSGYGWTTSYPVQLGLGWMLILPLGVLLFLPVYLCIRPALRRYRELQLKQPFIWTVIVAIYIVFGVISSRLSRETINWYIESGYSYITVISVLVLSALIFCVLWRYRNGLLKEQKYLQQMNTLLEEEYQSIQRQMKELNRNRRDVEQTVAKLDAMEGEDHAAAIEEYLHYLKSEHKRLSVGVYCDDYVLDAILTYGVRKCQEAGIQADFSAQGYISRGADEEEHILETLLDILEFGLWESMESKAEQKILEFKIGTVKNYTLVRMRCNKAENDRQLMKRFRKMVKNSDGTWKVEDVGGVRENTVCF